MAETAAVRRGKLLTIQKLITELVELNERGHRIATEMAAQNITDAEIAITVNKLYDGGGPPVSTVEATGDTVTDRIMNLLDGTVTGGVDWSYSAAV